MKATLGLSMMTLVQRGATITILVAVAMGCTPEECAGVLDAAAPIQELAEAGKAPELAAQVKALETAASGSKIEGIGWLVTAAKRLSAHVEDGTKPAGTIPDYTEDKARYLQSFVDARREVAGSCD